jgi:hypothetical protein
MKEFLRNLMGITFVGIAAWVCIWTVCAVFYLIALVISA